jgi:N6-L-threonylcarbamoyladenine synthase
MKKKPLPLIILGIETSCDETAASLVTSSRKILSNVILSQFEKHQDYGGIVPEIAARAHVDHIDQVIEEALIHAGLNLQDIDGIAVTAGPGLIGGVMVGVVTAKAIAMASQKPILAINHLEGHALSARLTDDIPFPYLLLLISGGHCQLINVKALGNYERLGTTIDDAAGEAFDKTAKILGLGVPGGPNLEKAAKGGDPLRFKLPEPLKGRGGCDFSFSGLKTALRREAHKHADQKGRLSKVDTKDLASSFEYTVSKCLKNKTKNAMDIFKTKLINPNHNLRFVVAGGVASNKRIRNDLSDLSQENGFLFHAPPLWLCTDNAAMIAWAGIERLKNGERDNLFFKARPRWPLDQKATAKIGSGKKGPKA